MAAKTQKQIDEEIKWLKENKEKVRHYTSFGDDNWQAIDAEIEALEGLDEDEIQELIDNGDWNENQREAAIRTIDWMNGDTTDESPSEGWKGLVNE